tara:strand:+ start:347 stop:718 length:372 start_codon:yes stop_codon:yes gene_type:complete
MALVPTLTINDTTTFSDTINFTVTDSLSVTTPSSSLTTVSVADTATAVLYADSGSNGTAFVYIKNTNTSNSYSVDIQTDNGNTTYGTLDNGEFAFIPIDTNEGVQVLGVGGTVVVEYAYWTKA